MYIQRLAEARLSGLLAGEKIGIILGGRQVGKTTLVEHGLAGRKGLSLNFEGEIDKQRFLAAASLSPKDALQSLGSPEFLVVHEAQRLPDTGRLVQGGDAGRMPVTI